jgi:Zn-dependent protease/CBS domain-containing protein
LRGSLKLFSIYGIPVDINATWLVAVVIITWSLSTGAYPAFFQMWSSQQYWIAGIVTTFLLFASVLAHELGHSFAALAQGLRVSGITLLLFGGVSRIQGKASRPRNEFLIAFAGPAVSLLIGLILMGWWIKFHPIHEHLVTPLHGVIFFTGWMNILVAGFNLLPGYPMDGGRVLRSAVWGFTGNTRLASKVALRVGRVVFYLLIGWGVWQIFNGDVVGGIWIGLIAWFLMSSARNEQEEQSNSVVLEQDRLSFTIGNIITPMPPMLEHDQLISDVLIELEGTRGKDSIPVSKGGELQGFITGIDLERISVEQRGKLIIGEITRSESLRFCSRLDSGRDALHAMDRYGVMQLVVMDDGYVFGIVTRQDITKAVQEFPYATDSSQPTDQA